MYIPVHYSYQTILKRDKNLGVSLCTNCNHTINQTLAKRYMQFRLYGIPLIQYRKTRCIMCESCGNIITLSKQQYKQQLAAPQNI